MKNAYGTSGLKIHLYVAKNLPHFYYIINLPLYTPTKQLFLIFKNIRILRNPIYSPVLVTSAFCSGSLTYMLKLTLWGHNC